MTLHGDRQRIEAEVNALLQRARGVDDELQSSLARYLCVLGSSYLEAAFREVVSSFCQDQASPKVRRYVQGTLDHFRNPNAEKILQLIGRFDSDCRKALEDNISGRLRDSVDSISANKNNVAHGRRSGITLAQVSQYFEDAKAVVSKARAILAK